MTDDPRPWPFSHNWRDDVAETLEFKTDVLTSPTGHEQRRAQRLSPRRIFELSHQVIDEARTMFDLAVSAGGGGEWLLPLWTLQTRLLTPVEPGDTILPLDTAGREFLADGYAMIRNTEFDYAVVEIDSIGDDQIILKDVLERSWPRGTTVFPMRVARFVEQPSVSRRTDTVGEAVVRFRITTQNDLPLGYVEEGTVEEYLGYPVLSMKPDERSVLTYGYTRFMAEFDNETGIPEIVDTAQASFPSQAFAWFLHGVEEHVSFRALMYALAGKHKAMWLPTFFADLEMVSDTPAGEAYLIIKKVGYTLYGGPNTGRRFIRIEMKNGTALYRRITGSALEGAAHERLPVNEVFADGLNVAEVHKISFLGLVRLDQDNIDISHKGDILGVATVRAVFRALHQGVWRAGFNRSFNRSFNGVAMEPM